jgi:hypothetical protein
MQIFKLYGVRSTVGQYGRWGLLELGSTTDEVLRTGNTGGWLSKPGLTMSIKLAVLGKVLQR